MHQRQGQGHKISLNRRPIPTHAQPTAAPTWQAAAAAHVGYGVQRPGGYVPAPHKRGVVPPVRPLRCAVHKVACGEHIVPAAAQESNHLPLSRHSIMHPGHEAWAAKLWLWVLPIVAPPGVDAAVGWGADGVGVRVAAAVDGLIQRGERGVGGVAAVAGGVAAGGDAQAAVGQVDAQPVPSGAWQVQA